MILEGLRLVTPPPPSVVPLPIFDGEANQSLSVKPILRVTW